MTKKDFELVANVLKAGREMPIEIRETGKKYISHDDLVAEKMADELEATNPLFNREKFLVACGVIEGIVAVE